MLSGGDPTAVGGFLVKKALSSKGVQSAIAQWLSKDRPAMGPIKADMGPSEVPQLPAPTEPSQTGGRGNNKTIITPDTINLPTSVRETNMGIDEVKNTKQQSQSPQETKQLSSPKSTSKTKSVKTSESITQKKLNGPKFQILGAPGEFIKLKSSGGFDTLYNPKTKTTVTVSSSKVKPIK
jgi:hypothetical protein